MENFDKLARQVKLLRSLVALLTVLVLAFGIVLFIQNRHRGEFTELTANRINIVEPGGRLALVISDHARQHPGRMNGKDLAPRNRPAGLIYFNEEGDECGGFSWDGNSKENGMILTADQYKNDQIMALYYQQDSASIPSRTYGFRLWDRSDRFTLQQEIDYIDSMQRRHDTAALTKGIDSLKKLGYLGVDRLFLGHTRDGLTGLFLRDEKGIPRLRLYIDRDNQPRLETLDDQGKVVGAWTGK
jgi:hypothetical protein